MEIVKPENLIVRGMLTPLKLSNVDSVAYHHMANDTWDFYDVESYHILTNGWMAIGYNYWIDYDGTVYEGRGLNTGAGISGHNNHVISVGLQGDFEKNVPTDAQYNACAELYLYLKEKVPTIKSYKKHSDFNATLCPGRNFNIERITEILKEKENTKMKEKIYNWTTACPHCSQSYVHKALDLGILKGEEDGRLNLNDTKIWVLIIIIRAIELLRKEK